MSAGGRYSRNEGLFGAEGQAKIARAKVTIAGLGGVGSHVAQQLAYLGVRSYALIDFDVVTDSSLNRLVGAFDADVSAETKKIAVAKRTIHTINPRSLCRGPRRQGGRSRCRCSDRAGRHGLRLRRSGHLPAGAHRDMR